MWNRYGTKYNNVKQTYNGYSYMSKKEAEYAYELDLRIKARDIISWERQVKMDLRVNDVHICNYYMDFVICHLDNSLEYVEIKGFETEVWKLKAKLFQAVYPDRKYTVIR